MAEAKAPAGKSDAERVAALLAKVPLLTVDQLIALTLDIRETRSKQKKAFEARDELLKSVNTACENYLMKLAQEQGVTGFKSDLGTSYITDTIRASIEDDAAFFDFIKANDEFGFLTRRISTQHLQEYMDAHDGAVPPGLNTYTEKGMSVRKAANPKKGKADA